VPEIAKAELKVGHMHKYTHGKLWRSGYIVPCVVNHGTDWR
jgi:hypothetical protein